jgi:hypothetical protein
MQFHHRMGRSRGALGQLYEKSILCIKSSMGVAGGRKLTESEITAHIDLSDGSTDLNEVGNVCWDRGSYRFKSVKSLLK